MMKKKFKGDIIITDPCYIMREDSEGDWSNSYYGERLDRLGIKHFLTSQTYYGDWSCTTFNSETKEPIGQFCADAGMVSVMYLDEVLAYNPDFDYHIDRKWTTTLIEGFDGEVEFKTSDYTWTSSLTGQDYEETELVIEGTGNINFIAKQTGY